MAEINNDHNVYILGAGFSAARGLPLISDFMFALRDAHQWLAAENRRSEADSVEQVLKFRLHSTPTAYRVQIDLENIEDLFSLAAAADDSLTQHIRIAIAATLDYRQAITAIPKTRFNLEMGGPPLPKCLKENVIHAGATPSASQIEVLTYDFLLAGLLGYLDANLPYQGNSIVSFNYDLLVENALVSLKVPFSYGFGNRTVVEDPTAETFQLRPDAKVELLELHGSANWVYPGGRGGKLRIFDSYERLHTAGYIPELVPPTWRKSFDGPLTHVWRRALEQISRATRLVVIGFSMPPTDLHFKYLLAAGLRENISLREIVFVNPDCQSVEVRARALFGDLDRRPRARLVQTDTKNFVGQGELPTTVASVGRTIHRSIQQVFHSY